MKKQVYFYLLLMSTFAHTCVVPERVDEITRQLTEREQMYAQRRRIARACAITGVTAMIGVMLYNWYTQPLLTPAEQVTLGDIQALAGDTHVRETMKVLRGDQPAPAPTSWLWKHVTGFSSFVAQTGVAGVISMGLQQAYAQGNQLLNPRITRFIASSAYLTDSYRNVVETDQLIQITLSRDVDFFITQVDMVDYSINARNADILQEAAHGILGCLDYVADCMEKSSETSRVLMGELAKIRALVCAQLEELHALLRADQCDQARLWSVHEEFCATIRKLKVFELLRI